MHNQWIKTNWSEYNLQRATFVEQIILSWSHSASFLLNKTSSFSTFLSKSEWTFQCFTELTLGFIKPATISLGLCFCVFNSPILKCLSSVLFLSELIAYLLWDFKIICLLMSPNVVNLFLKKGWTTHKFAEWASCSPEPYCMLFMWENEATDYNLFIFSCIFFVKTMNITKTQQLLLYC